MKAWFRVLLYQNSNHSHYWFIQWDQHFNSFLPNWFLQWWEQFGPDPSIFAEPLQIQINHFSKKSCDWNKINSHVPMHLAFISKYKVPWIVKWQFNIFTPNHVESYSLPGSNIIHDIIYHSQIDMVSRQVFTKWWDKFNHDRIITQVKKEFPLVNSLPTAPSSIAKIDTGKASVSGTKEVKPSVTKASSAKEKKPKSSPTKSSEEKSTKKCFKSEIMKMVMALSKQVSDMNDSEDEEDKPSPPSDQGSTNEDPYDDELYQDG